MASSLSRRTFIAATAATATLARTPLSAQSHDLAGLTFKRASELIRKEDGITCGTRSSVLTADGGSSGGSAAAVAADLCFGALGTDTAGSLQAMAGFDQLDPASNNVPVPEYSLAFTKPVSKLGLGNSTLAVLREFASRSCRGDQRSHRGFTQAHSADLRHNRSGRVSACASDHRS